MNKDRRDVSVANEADGDTLLVEAKVGIFLVTHVSEVAGIDQIGVGNNEIAHHGGEGELAEPFTLVHAQLFAGPFQRGFGVLVAPIQFHVCRCELIVIATNDRAVKGLHQVYAFCGVGAIANDVTQTEESFQSALPGVFYDRFESFDVPMNI
ncbi:hypothetical protein N9A94_01560 [Akkermansiaceae bacterium]|nr:hypothetical protein [Akkermansiaceae bacterium]